MSFEIHITKKLENFTLQADLSSNGNCTGILGESGCGKSMFLKCIAGIETPDEGSIVLNGQVLFDSAKKINLPPQKRNIGYLFQNYALFPSMTVEENIAAGLFAGKRFISRKEKAQADAIVKEQIRRCRLEGLEKHYPSHLSGGQQQRTALARMLAVQPSMILLDEPFSALDSHLKDAMQREMHEIIRNYPGNVLIVSHSRDELYRLCDSLCVMDRGQFVQKGSIKEVFQSPGHVKAARLTGCKNITPARQIGDQLFEAPEWGLTLHSESSNPSAAYIGIRAHYFRLLSARTAAEQSISEQPVSKQSVSEQSVSEQLLSKQMSPEQTPSDTINQFQAQIVQVDERPFEYDYYLKTEQGSSSFVWKIAKSPDTEFQPGDWLMLYVAPEDVMLLND